ncbi:MAG TPA: twin-arginine translocase TatA/TatE family subunit [Candidatus Saccharimonadales bacterium]
MDFGFLDLGTADLVIILLIVLLLFGGKKLPDLAKSIGSSAHELRKGLNEGGNEKSEKQSEDKKQQAS